MNALEKIKLSTELKGLFKQFKARSISGLSAIKAVKRFKAMNIPLTLFTLI